MDTKDLLLTMGLTALPCWAATMLVMKRYRARMEAFVKKRDKILGGPVPVTVSRSGMVKVEVENIESIDQVDYDLNNSTGTQFVPAKTLHYVRTISGTRIAHGALYASTAQADSRERDDIRRGMTLGSCFYGYAIPESAVLIDYLTKQYFYDVLRDAYPQQVSTPPPLKPMKLGSYEPGIDIPSDEDMQRYMDMTIQIGAVLAIFADLPMYPPKTCFMEEVKTRAGVQLRQLNNKKLPSVAEIFSMVTAFAYLTKMPIPKKYHEENAFTAMLIRELKYRHHKPKLALVKKQKETP